jgi:hypothetical protein
MISVMPFSSQTLLILLGQVLDFKQGLMTKQQLLLQLQYATPNPPPAPTQSRSAVSPILIPSDHPNSFCRY